MCEIGIEEILESESVGLVSYLPDYYLDGILQEVNRSSNCRKILLAKEEDGIGLSAGAAIAGVRPLLIIQSDGLGNCFNAIQSLTFSYNLPLPIIASYRGGPKDRDLSHFQFGSKLTEMLRASNIKFKIARTLIEERQVISSIVKDSFLTDSVGVALINPLGIGIGKHETIFKHSKTKVDNTRIQRNKPIKATMDSFDFIEGLLKIVRSEAIISSLGLLSKLLFNLGDRKQNLYILGSMGLATSIGLGCSLFSDKEFIILIGDGSILSNLGALCTVALYGKGNITIIAIDNGTYESSGKFQTYTSMGIHLEEIATSCGFQHSIVTSSIDELALILSTKSENPKFVRFLVKQLDDSFDQKALEYPEMIHSKERFSRFLRE